jgi:hypothetical protein
MTWKLKLPCMYVTGPAQQAAQRAGQGGGASAPDLAGRQFCCHSPAGFALWQWQVRLRCCLFGNARAKLAVMHRQHSCAMVTGALAADAWSLP